VEYRYADGKTERYLTSLTNLSVYRRCNRRRAAPGAGRQEGDRDDTIDYLAQILLRLDSSRRAVTSPV
jgi:hypothetical protein